jgi:hypothetical protein
MPVRSCTGIPWRSYCGAGKSRRAGGREDVRGLRALLVEAHLGEVDLERSLWRLAYEAHAEGPAGDAAAGTAGIGELKLLKTLAALKEHDHGWAHRVIEAIKLGRGCCSS